MKNQRMLDELTELMRIDVSSGQEMEIAEHAGGKTGADGIFDYAG
ncbi:MAG: hypothetical protein ACLUYY_12795 [Blautia sp.]